MDKPLAQELAEERYPRNETIRRHEVFQPTDEFS
jgi:hypothetical protein